MKRNSACRKFLSGMAMIVGLVAGVSAADAQVRISQIYGGGGNGSGVFRNDFIELFNAGTAAVDLTGMSVQYTSAGGSGTWLVTPLTAFMLQPGQYYLVQELAGADMTQPLLPTPDATGTIAMSATAGKLALVMGVTALSGACPTAGVIDQLGYGATATCSEGGAPAPGTSNPVGLLRANGGCQDTNNNMADFAALTPAPRNSASPAAPCQASTPPSGVGASNPADACANETVTLTVTVTPGQVPISTGIAVTGDTTSIGGGPGIAFLDDGVFPDATAGDNVFTTQAIVQTGTPTGNRSIPVVITDAEFRTGNTSVTVAVLFCNIGGFGRATPPGACNGDTVLLTVDVTPGIRPDSTGITVVTDLSSIGGAFDQAFYDDATHGDVVAGDTIYSFAATIPGNQPGGMVQMVAIIQDAQARVNTATIDFTPVPDCTNSASTIVISQIYGGGGNIGGVFVNDYIELFNRSSLPVSIDGWSVQYASGSSPSGFNTKTDLAGTIPAGGYYLIQEDAGDDMSQPPLPTPDAPGGTLMLGATAGRVALVRDGNLILLDCAASTVEDLVGYGNVFCYEGVDNGPTLTNSLAVFRLNNGCRDTNQNVADLFSGTPAPRNSDSPTNNCNPVTTGACCLTDGSCVSATSAGCSSQKGMYNGDGSACGSVKCPQPVLCPCDWNHDNVLNSQDFFDFIAAFFGAGADFNMDGMTNSQDFFDFLSCFFAPPPACP